MKKVEIGATRAELDLARLTLWRRDIRALSVASQVPPPPTCGLDDPDVIYVCPECDATFITPHAWATHRANHRPEVDLARTVALGGRVPVLQ
eukprot:7095111-Pyramimonas_sp.AAC.1